MIKKKSGKVISFLLAFAMILTSFGNLAFAAQVDSEAAAKAVVEIGSVAQAKQAGDEFTVTANLTKNETGLMGYTLAADYDQEALELISITQGEVSQAIGGSFTANPAKNLVVLGGNNAANNTGSLVDLTFKVKDAAKSGSYNINLKIEDEADFFDGEYNSVDVYFKAGTVKIASDLTVESTTADNKTTTNVSGTSVKADENGNLTVDATTEDAATAAQVNFDKGTVSALGSSALDSLTVNTNAGSLVLDQKAISDFVNAANGADAAIVIEKLADTTASVANIKAQYKVAFVVNGAEITALTGKATVALPYAKQYAKSTVKAYAVKDSSAVKADYADGVVTFKTGELGEFAVAEAANSEYTLKLVADKAYANAGDTVKVNVVVDSDSLPAFTTMQANISYDDSVLQYVNFTQENGAVVTNSSQGTNVLFASRQGSELEIADGGVVVTTLTYKVKADVPAGIKAAEFAAENVLVGNHTEEGNEAAVENETVNICNLTATFEAGENTTLSEGAKVAYIKYGEAGFYTDNTYKTAFSIPEVTAAEGYTVSSKLWNDGEKGYSAAELAKATFENNVTLTAQAAKNSDIQISFNVTPADATVKVMTGDEEVLPDVNGKYNLTDGTAYTYTVTRDNYDSKSGSFTASAGMEDINVSLALGQLVFINDYAAAPTGYKVAVLLTEKPVTDGYAYTFNRNEMYYSEKYGALFKNKGENLNAYVYFVDAELDEATAMMKIGLAESITGNKVVKYNMDVNANMKVNIFDAQMSYDLYTQYVEYMNDNGFAKVSMQSRLEADADGSGQVDVLDARAIQYYIHSVN